MDIGKINGASNGNNIDTAKSKAAEAADESFENRLQSAMDKNDEKELRKVCKDFESIYLNMMYKQMKATVPKSDLIPSDMGKEIFETMLDDKLVEEASKSGGVGLSDMMYKQLSRQMKAKYKPVSEGKDGISEEK